MAPVAKRNFCRRHDHGMTANGHPPSLGSNGDNDDDDDDMDESEHSADWERGEIAPLDIVKELKGNPPSSSNKATAVSSSDKVKRKLVGKSNKSSKEGGESMAVIGKGSTVAGASEKRQKMWSDLLARRPRTRDPRNLSSWLNEVLTVSDMEFPIDQYDVEPSSRTTFYSLAVAGNGLLPPTRDNNVVVQGNKGKSRGASTGSRGDVFTAQATTKVKRKAKADSLVPTKVVKKVKVKKSLGASKPKVGGTGSDVPTKILANKDVKLKEEKALPASKRLDDILMEDTKSPPSPGSQANTTKESAPSATEPDDCFAGSFADWRDRKKGKAFKKGSGSLRK